MKVKKPKSLGRTTLSPFREFEHTGANDIIVIGYQTPKDDTSLFMIGCWFATRRKDHTVLNRLGKTIKMDSYDMATHPERGDALDYITGETQFVIALHLNGLHHELDTTAMDQDAIAEMEANDGLCKGYRYTRNNWELADWCLANGVSLICQGEQPAYVPGDYEYTEMYDGSNGPLVCLYEPKATVVKLKSKVVVQ